MCLWLRFCLIVIACKFIFVIVMYSLLFLMVRLCVILCRHAIQYTGMLYIIYITIFKIIHRDNNNLWGRTDQKIGGNALFISWIDWRNSFLFLLDEWGRCTLRKILTNKFIIYATFSKELRKFYSRTVMHGTTQSITCT